MKKILKLVSILMFIFCITGCNKHKHELIYVEQKEATCQETGILEHWKCKTCETCFLDELGKIEIQDITIKKVEHTYGDWIIDEIVTCTTKGKMHKVCTVCKEVVEENIKKLEHTWKEATCTNPKKCTMCGTTEGKTLEHICSDWIMDRVTTCSLEGKKHKECMVCQKVLEEETITKLEHTYSDWIMDRTPTCISKGKKHKECMVCQEVLEEENIAELEHTWKNATCTAPKTCSFCGKNEGTPLGHIYDTSNIKWEWSENYEEAVAVLTCKNDETHQQRIDAMITNEETMESITYTATITYNNVTYTNIKQNIFSLEYELNQDKTSYTVTGIGTYKDINIVIFSEYNGLPVTSIGEYAFSGCSTLASVSIPNSITNIEKNAFYRCNSITSIVLPSSVISIGDYAFFGCSSITSIMIPNSVISIGEYVFSHCSGLIKMIVDEDNLIYDSRENCNAIIDTATKTLIAGCQNTVIPNSITSIGKSAFSGCSGLISITIPNSVTSIGNAAFSACSNLTSIAIPSGVTSIKDATFWSCRSLTNVTLGDNITCIGNSAFIGCSSLTSISLPNTITNIGVRTFYNCGNLQYNEYNHCYYLGNEENPYLALIKAENTSITNVIVHKDTKVMSSQAFSGCSILNDVTLPDGVICIGDYAFSLCNSLTSIVLPNSLTSIGRCAFIGCHNLISINIPNSVTWIGDRNFGTCDRLQYNEYENGYYLGNEENPYIVFVKAKDTSITNAVIHNNTKFICSEAFSHCFNLESITLSSNLISIGDYAFGNCGNLTSIVLPNSVTWISRKAFINCTNLTSVTFENTNGWFVTKDVNKTTGITIDVSDAIRNKEYFTSTYDNYYWKRS